MIKINQFFYHAKFIILLVFCDCIGRRWWIGRCDWRLLRPDSRILLRCFRRIQSLLILFRSYQTPVQRVVFTWTQKYHEWKVYFASTYESITHNVLTWILWFEESATTIKLSGPTATPLGQVKYPGSLPLPPILNNNCRFCRYCTLGVEPTPCIPKTK